MLWHIDYIDYEIQDAYQPSLCSTCVWGHPYVCPTPGTWAVAVVLQRVPWSQEVLYHLHRSCRTLESGEKRVTLPETIQNAPGKDKETSIPTIHFIILFYPFSGVKSQLVLLRFFVVKKKSQQLYSKTKHRMVSWMMHVKDSRSYPGGQSLVGLGFLGMYTSS